MPGRRRKTAAQAGAEPSHLNTVASESEGVTNSPVTKSAHPLTAPGRRRKLAAQADTSQSQSIADTSESTAVAAKFTPRENKANSKFVQPDPKVSGSHASRASNGVAAPPPSVTNAPEQPAARRNARTSGGEEVRESRALRSKDGGSRLKSDLATYFSNYDDIITDAPKAPVFIEPDEPILIVDQPLSPPDDASPNSKQAIKLATPAKAKLPPLPSPHKITTNAKTILFECPSSSPPEIDPLSDDVYIKPHRKLERKEKQLRNIERERAQHEKAQLDRLLDGLQGPDWLRVMGITGVTDGERKDWEPKRTYFVDEVSALVDKFARMKQEEKRVREEKARHRGANTTASMSLVSAEPEEAQDDEAETDEPTRQLQREAIIARVPPRRKRTAAALDAPAAPPAPPAPAEPFISFFAKPHQRAAAIGERRSSRSTLAFGQPLPSKVSETRDFELPAGYVTEEVLRARARKRRRMNREANEGEGKGKKRRGV
ncbi:hypothetical protein EJ06DRAFT_554170 [Trichodelitschia bisporula]|uniref:Something about silencing protein 4 domain-containing protein n=1 Tax=Trichodelitschia bisporula TaxID=703511 RepID=A0A6G1I6N2_9PEZI|nr:hypothetical protein EJ06DRAFT_554170 [Trichodelitschia bisporula]